MILYGKELDDELIKRKQAKNERIAQRISLRDEARRKNISVTELLDYEYGCNACPHEEYKDQVGGFPIPQLVFKVCKKCGKVNPKTTEKVNDTNLDRVYDVLKECMSQKEDVSLNKK
jgi:hypothetical protein